MNEKTRAELIAELKNQPAPNLSQPSSSGGDPFAALREPVGSEERFQYAIVNVGMFQSSSRMAEALATAGQNGWELVTVYDKVSNWMSGMEKGFLLLKRPVAPGKAPRSWCVAIRG